MFKVVIKYPGKPAEIKDYETHDKFNLNEIQRIVDGLFEVVTLNHDGKYITVYCNEEGKLMGLEPNVCLMYGEKIADVVCGPVIAVSNEVGDEGETLPLSDEEAEAAKKALDALAF